MGTVLLADGGSSSVKWAIIRPEQRVEFCESPALNPLFGTHSEHLTTIANALSPRLNGAPVDEVHFYGAACGADQPGDRIHRVLQEAFPAAQIHTDSDMIAASLACWRGQPGLTAIVGTGSNVGYYDGHKMVYYRPSLGYVLGDEGSGAWIGKRLVRDWLYGYLPTGLARALHDFAGGTCGVSQCEHGVYSCKEIVEQVYRGEHPNAYLSRFAQVAIEHRDVPYCHDLLREAMGQFVQHLCVPAKQCDQVELRAAGTVAWHCCDHLAEACHDAGLHLGEVQRSPIVGLAQHWMASQGGSPILHTAAGS